MVTNGFMHEFTRQNGDVPFAHVGSRVFFSQVWKFGNGPTGSQDVPFLPATKKKVSSLWHWCISHVYAICSMGLEYLPIFGLNLW